MAKKKNVRHINKLSGPYGIIEDRFNTLYKNSFGRGEIGKNVKATAEKDKNTINDEDALRSLNSYLEYDDYYSIDKDRYDYTTERFYLRKNIAIKYYDQAKESFGSNYTEKSFAELWSECNSLIFCGGYNGYDRVNEILLSSAIWILDHLTVSRKMEELYSILCKLPDSYFDIPIDIDNMDELVLPLSHPMYSNKIIYCLTQVLIHRNDAFMRQSDRSGKLYYDELKEDGHSIVNQVYKSIIALIDSAEVSRLVKNYEEKVWEFYGLFFDVKDCINKEIDRVEKEINKTIDAIEKQSIIAKKAMPMPQNMVLAKMQSRDVINFDLNSVRSDPKLAELYKIKEIKEKEQKNLDWILASNISRIISPNSREGFFKSLKGRVPNEIVEKMIHFSVDDPFEYAFALFYLLNNKSEIPWLYYGSIAVFYTIIDELPFSCMPSEFICDFEKSLRVDAKLNEEIYRLRYSGVKFEGEVGDLEEPLDREYSLNVAQKLYQSTATVIPRLTNGKIDYEEDIEKNIMLSITSAEAMKTDDFTEAIFNFKISQKEKEIEVMTEGQSVEELKNIIKIQKNQIDQLRNENNLVTSKNSELNKKIRALNDAENRMVRELADLREIVFNKENEISENDNEKNDIKFPFSTKETKIVSFGGHIDWLKSIKPMLPDVTFVSPEVVPNADLIRNADEIWIQPLCLSHSAFYKIINIVRSHNKNLRYFMYAGVNKCAAQMAKSYEK